MTNKDIYKIWAPFKAKWTDWVKPVVFIAIDSTRKITVGDDFVLAKIDYINSLASDTAIIVDQPGAQSIMEGIALAHIGFRPIPLFNGTKQQEGAMALVDTQLIENALYSTALQLAKIKLKDDAPPAFLLDSNRTHRFKMSASVFDNSWDLYDQDIPSANYFIKNGISRILVKGQKIESDLTKILYKYQKKGITILFTDGYQPVKVIILKKPGFLQSLLKDIREKY